VSETERDALVEWEALVADDKSSGPGQPRYRWIGMARDLATELRAARARLSREGERPALPSPWMDEVTAVTRENRGLRASLERIESRRERCSRIRRALEDIADAQPGVATVEGLARIARATLDARPPEESAPPTISTVTLTEEELQGMRERGEVSYTRGPTSEADLHESLGFVRDTIGRTFTGHVTADERRQCLTILDRIIGRSA